MNNYIYWVVIYLVFSLIYAQTFKKANRNMLANCIKLEKIYCGFM